MTDVKDEVAENSEFREAMKVHHNELIEHLRTRLGDDPIWDLLKVTEGEVST